MMLGKISPSTLLFGLLFAACFLLAGPAPAQRQERTLSAGWKFLRADAAPDAGTGAWQAVSVPHTWNAADGEDAAPGYYRGPAWYERALDVPAGWRGRRVFLRFEAASLVADVYVNGAHLGQHRGGFTAFCYEVTPWLRFDGTDDLRVRVDNARQNDVAPLSGDFTVFGGLYRPVHLLTTGPVCVSPLDYASSGVYLTLKSLNNQQAVVEARTLLSNSLSAETPVRLETQVIDAAGVAVASQSDTLALPAAQTGAVTQTLRIAAPHLWSGRTDPYLYSVRVRVLRGSALLDEETQPLGVRTVAVTQGQGFLLNNAPYPLHGVNRHQERQGEGWALSPADHDEDLRLILDMGATAVRLAHYPQSEYVYDRCDRNGLLLWTEIPQVNEIRLTPQFAANAELQLREMILQRYNHPSAAFWGLSNELAGPYVTSAVPELERLKGVALSLDRSRLIVSAAKADVYAIGRVPDQLGYNAYPGWYAGHGGVGDMGKTIARVAKTYGGRIAVSEYGAGGNPAQHEEGPLVKPLEGGPFHPEEWQTLVHQSDWGRMAGNPSLWGTFVWAMFDFASEGRSEGGTPNLNDKGLVTHDRRIRKDAYFFYKANWNPEPMVYLASRRMTPRAEAVTQVEAFSNCPRVELRVNGASLGVAAPDDEHVFRWEGVRLRPGDNLIQAVGLSGGREIKDECRWALAGTFSAPRPLLGGVPERTNNTMKTSKLSTLALLPVAATLLASALPAQAGILHKHPVAAGLGAGLVAHHMAKKGAASRMAHGQKPNMAERHPLLSGLAAGGAAHHMLKK